MAESLAMKNVALQGGVSKAGAWLRCTKPMHQIGEISLETGSPCRQNAVGRTQLYGCTHLEGYAVPSHAWRMGEGCTSHKYPRNCATA